MTLNTWLLWHFIRLSSRSGEDDIEKALAGLKTVAKELQEVQDAEVSKLDLLFAICQAVIEEFPQIRANPHVVAFRERLQAFQERIEKKKAMADYKGPP